MSWFDRACPRRFDINREAKEANWGEKTMRLIVRFPLLNPLVLCAFVCVHAVLTHMLSFCLLAVLLLEYTVWLTREFISWVQPRGALPRARVDVWLVEHRRPREENYSVLLSSIRRHTVAFIWVQSNKKLSCITGSSHATHAWMQRARARVRARRASTSFRAEAHSPWACVRLHSVSFSNCLYKYCTTLSWCCG